MRDIVLTVMVLVLLPFIFKHPVIGAYAWAWLSLMNPHKLTYGFARSLPFAQIVALVTLVAFLATHKRSRLPVNGIMVWYVLLLLWMTTTSFFALAAFDFVQERWIFVMKMHLMLFVTLMLIQDRRQLQILIWVVTFSVAFFGIKGGVWTVMTGGGGRVWGPPGGMLQGNNELAVALVMLMPMLYYLHQTTPNRWVRHGLKFCMISSAFSILGSQSRGALLALISMSLFLGLKGKYPIRTTLAIGAMVAIAITFMPESWTERMETISTYQQDGSAMSRIWTWKTLFAAAVDRPLVGVGYGADSHAVFARYAPTGPEWQIFEGSVYVAHSIYFQMLGEHGFVGLALFLGLGLAAWWNASRLAKAGERDPEFRAWLPALMRMIQVSLIGYAIGGMFLSLAYLDLPFYMIGFVIAAEMLMQKRLAAPRATPAGAARDMGGSVVGSRGA